METLKNLFEFGLMCRASASSNADRSSNRFVSTYTNKFLVFFEKQKK